MAYKVQRSSDRKGKTHKVTNTKTGEVKYFGDPNLKNKPGTKAAKNAKARHKKNLDKNPFFRAYWRATWQSGGEYQDGVEFSEESLINTTGYTPGTSTEDNPYNIIPSANITMEDVDMELLGISLGEDGKPQGFKFMKPGKNYKYKDTKSVIEIPTYQEGGQPTIGRNIQRINEIYEPVLRKVLGAYGHTDLGDGVSPSFMKAFNELLENKDIDENTRNFLDSTFNPTLDNIKRRNLPPVNEDIKNIQEVIMRMEDQEVKDLLSKDYSDVTLLNFKKYLPKDISFFEALGYAKRFKKLQKEGFTMKKGGKYQIGGESIDTALNNIFQNPQQFSTSLNEQNTPLNFSTQTPSLTNNINPITGTEIQQEQPNNQEEEINLRQREQVQFFNQYAGVDIPTAASTLGQSIANKDTLGIVGSGAKLGLGLARNTLGAFAQQNRTNQVMNDYYNRQRKDFDRPQFIGSFQQGGVSNIVEGFEEELLAQILGEQQEKQVPQQMQLDLQKYADVNYFDTKYLGDNRFVLSNTANNPQNAANIKTQLDYIREQNPNAVIDFQYRNFQQGGDLTTQDVQNINQSIGADIDPSLINQLFERNVAPGAPDVPSVDLGKYARVGYFDVLQSRPDSIVLQNTSKSPHTRESINQILPQLRKLNPGREITFSFQDGGSIDEILNSFEDEQLINSILQAQQAPVQPQSLDLGKYSDANYFNVDSVDGQYIISNTANNPQNAAGFKDQIQRIQQQNPNAAITMKYLPQLQKGGMVDSKLMTGEYITGVDQKDPRQMQQVTGEVEAGEYYKTNQGDIAEVVGEKHSNGGEKMAMEQGDKVLTDHTKLGAKNAKHIRDNFDLDIKAKHTYSDVLDKFKKKMGLNKLVDEEEGLIEKLEMEQEKDDSQTKKLNIDFINTKLNEISKKKEPIEEARKVLFDKLFDMQEDQKDSSTRQEFKKGGIKEMAAKYGIDEDKAYQMYKQFKKGGYYAQEGVDTDPSKKKVETEVIEGENPFNIAEDFIHQSKTQGIYFGKAAKERLDALEQNFPLLVEQTFDIERAEDGSIEDVKLKKGQTIEAFQRAVDTNYQGLINDAQRLGDPSRVKSFVDKVTAERFNNQVARGFDDKFGNFTSSRPNFGFRSVTPEDLKKLKDKGVFTYKQLLDENGQLKEDLDISPESKKLLEKFKDSESNFLLGDKDVISSAPLAPSSSLERVDNILPEQGTAPGNIAFLPNQYPLMPGALEPHLKVSRRFDRVTAQQVDYEPFLEQIFQQEQTSKRQLEGLPPSVKAAAEANINANTQRAVADTMLKIEGANQQAKQQAEFTNANVQRLEENAAAQDALNFEQRQLRAKAITDQNVRNYFNNLQQVNKQNFQDINDLNLMNALYDDVQYRGDGTFSVSETPDFKDSLEAIFAQQGIKPKSKNK